MCAVFWHYKYFSRIPVTLCVISPVINSDWICFGVLSLSQIFAATMSCRDSSLLLEAFNTSSSSEELCLPRYITFSSLLRMCILGRAILNLSSIRLSFHRLKRTDLSQFQICEREFFKSWPARPDIVEICQFSNILVSWSLLWLISVVKMPRLGADVTLMDLNLYFL